MSSQRFAMPDATWRIVWKSFAVLAEATRPVKPRKPTRPTRGSSNAVSAVNASERKKNAHGGRFPPINRPRCFPRPA